MATDSSASLVESKAGKGLEWKWIIFGVFAGTALSISLHRVIAQTFLIPLIPTFMSLLGFVVMGIIMGYKSEGYTIKEPAIGGLMTVLLVGLILMLGFNYKFTTVEIFGGAIVGLILGFIGGWVGEQIQVTQEEAAQELEEEKQGGLQWGWIIAGTVIGFILNAFFVIGGFALLKFSTSGILMALSASFLFAGILVGYFSPGVTIWEAALSGALSIIINVIFLLAFKLLQMDELVYAAIGLVGAFILSLIGGWAGEKMQAFVESKDEEEK